tara:strand:- start:504 stop:776 length:273 start_codon:yes stop_codon:yes gene_type:complete
MIELGGNIKLEGFEELPREKLIVFKKIIGSFTREISEQDTQFKQILVTLEGEYKIKIEISGKKETISEIQDKNLFFALSMAIKEAKSKYL